MKRFCCLIIGITMISFAIAQSSFDGAIYQNSQHSSSLEIIETSTQDYVITGGTSPVMHNHYPHLIKLDSSGNFLWQRQIPSVEYAFRILQLNDGNYLLTSPGTTTSLTQDDRLNVTFLNLDTAANINWQRGINDTMYSFDFHDIITDVDGGFVFIGRKDSASTSSGLITKYDINGNLIFQKNYLTHVGQQQYILSYKENDFVRMIQIADSTYFVLASISGAPTIIHLDAQGDSINAWAIPDTIQPTEVNYISDISLQGNNLITLISTYDTTLSSHIKTFYSTMDITSGTFNKQLTAHINAFLPSDNNSKIILTLCSNNFSSLNGSIEKRDSTNNLIWDFCLNPSFVIFPGYFNLNQSSDNGILFTGTIDSSNAGQYESIYYLKLDSGGHLLTATLPIEDHSNSFEVFPNPASDKIIIRSENTEIIEVRLKDIFGKEIFYSNYNPEVIDIGNLKPGIYLAELKNREGIVVRKFIKEDK